MTAAYRELAKSHGLVWTGGSDFHGTPKPDIQLGTGSLQVPPEALAALAACHLEIRGAA